MLEIREYAEIDGLLGADRAAVSQQVAVRGAVRTHMRKWASPSLGWLQWWMMPFMSKYRLSA